MRKPIGLLFLVAAAVCGTLAYMRLGDRLQYAVKTQWVALPLGALAGFVLGLILLLNVKRGFGVVFLLAGVGCLLIAYANGGPAWRESFDIRRMMRQGGAIAAGGGLVCLFLGLGLTFGRQRR